MEMDKKYLYRRRICFLPSSSIMKKKKKKDSGVGFYDLLLVPQCNIVQVLFASYLCNTEFGIRMSSMCMLLSSLLGK